MYIHQDVKATYTIRTPRAKVKLDWDAGLLLLGPKPEALETTSAIKEFVFAKKTT